MSLLGIDASVGWPSIQPALPVGTAHLTAGLASAIRSHLGHVPNAVTARPLFTAGAPLPSWPFQRSAAPADRLMPPCFRSMPRPAPTPSARLPPACLAG